MLPVLYEFPHDMQKDRNAWRDPKNWAMVTPNAGRSISIPRLEEEFATAEASGEEELCGWASQHLDIEIGLQLRSDRWAGADFWEGQAEDGLTLETLLARSEVVTAGIDGGGLDDLLGLAVVGRDCLTGDWLVWTHAWAHTSVLERRKQEAPRFRDFETAGELTIVEKMGTDIDELAAIVAKIHETGLMDSEKDDEPRVGVDPYGIGAILTAIVEAGVPQVKIIGISQGWKLGAAIKTSERKLAEGTLWHGGGLMMPWCVGNARVEPKGNSILITKQASGSAKIDPLMGMFSAVSLMALNPVVARPKAYQLLFLGSKAA